MFLMFAGDYLNLSGGEAETLKAKQLPLCHRTGENIKPLCLQPQDHFLYSFNSIQKGLLFFKEFYNNL